MAHAKNIRKRFFQIISILDESFKNEIVKRGVRFLNESDEDIDNSYYQDYDELKRELFNDFLYHNNNNFTKNVPWTVIPFPRLKKVWEDYMTYGSVRDTRGLEMIEDIMKNNTMKVIIFTNLAGHTQWGDEEAFNENIGYWVDEQINCVYNKPFDKNQLEIPFNNPKKGYKEPEDNSPCQTTVHPFVKEFIEEKYGDELPNREELRKYLNEKMVELFFDYYQNDPKGDMGSFISDYGLKPLEDLLYELLRAGSSEEKLLIIDRMLNVVHQRSDIAEWFVEGGSRALQQLSGSPSEILNESKFNDNKQSLMRSKSISKEMKEEILKYFTGGSTYKEGGHVHGLTKPKELTDKTPKTSGVSMGADKDGFFVYTHRARSGSHAEPGKIPIKEINFIESTG